MPSSASIAGKAEPYSSKYHEEDEDEGCAVEAPGTSGRRGAARSVRVAAAAEPQPKIGSFFTKKEAAAAAKGEKREVKQEPKPEASPPSGKGVSGKRKGSGAPAAAGGAAKKTKGSPGKADKVTKDEQAASGASAGSDQRKLPRGKPKHRVGDKVLGMSVISNGEMYEAVVVKVREELSQYGDMTWEYFLKYKNWKSKWNEWILEEHVFKCDKEGWELFESNNACVREERAARIAAEKRAKAAGKAGGKEAKKEDNIDKANETVTEKHYLLPIPSTLQRRLLDDLDMVEEHKLLPLPRDPSFEHVLQRFEDAMLAGKAPEADPAGLAAFCAGLRAYFDRVAPVALCYSFEQVQMRDFWHKAMAVSEANPAVAVPRPSEVYGAEHLLRLIVKLPKLMQACQADEGLSRDAQARFTQLLKWMDKEQDIFQKVLEPTDMEYLEKHLKELSS